MKQKMVLPCLRGVMGDWVYYSSMMTVEQITAWIQASKEIREAKTLDEELQRALKDRKKAIAKYLLHTDRRFFNSLVVGVYGGLPDWVEFDLSKTMSLVGSGDYYNELKESIGLMVFNGNEMMFAIDGQHRVAGIKIARDEEQQKKPSNRVLTRDQFPVVFVAHKDDELGRKRTRKLFSDINKNAKAVAEGDKIKIDEEDLNAIVTRRIYASYKHFKKGKLISLTENAKLEQKDEAHFTNLLGLNNTHKVLRKLFKKKPKTEIWDEDNVVEFQRIVEEFYNYVIVTIPEYNNFFLKEKLTLKQARKDNKYLLFRPIGLKLLARLYVHYRPKEGGLEIMAKKVKSLGFVMPDSPFNNILWIGGKMEAKTKSQKLAFDLALYLMGEMHKNEVPDLLAAYREALRNPEAELPEKLK